MTSRLMGVRNLPGWLPCSTCQGTGQYTLVIEAGRVVTCSACEGHGAYPGPDAVDGPYWFYKSLARRSDGMLVAESDKVGYLMRREGFEWEWEYFDRNGPCGGVERASNVIMIELDGYRYTPMAAGLLDEWAKRPAWRQAVRYQLFRGYEGLLRAHGYQDAAWDVRRAVGSNLDLALYFIKQLKARYVPGNYPLFE